MRFAAPLSRKILAVVLLASLFFSHHRLNRLYTLPYPHFDRLLLSSHGLQDISIISVGFRALAADLAWIQLLQYTGGDLLPGEQAGRYELLGPMTRRVIRIDPHFYRAYLFGAGILAWFRTINRPQEALELLREGIDRNPQYWPLRQYYAAIAYKLENQSDKEVAVLAEAIRHPDCPAVVKSILANLYKKRGEYAPAILVLQNILETPQDGAYHVHAEREIWALRDLMRGRKKK